MDEGILFKSPFPESKLQLYFTKGLDLQMPEFMIKKKKKSKRRKSKKVTQLSPELKEMISKTETPKVLALTADSAYSDDVEIEKVKLDLPIIKDEARAAEMKTFSRSSLPETLKQMKARLKIKKKALDMCKKGRLSVEQLQIYFPTDITMLESGIENMSLDMKNNAKAQIPKYALQSKKKKNYCERGEEESEDGESGDDYDATKIEEEEEDEEEDDEAMKELKVKVSRRKLSWEMPDMMAARSVPDGLVLECSDLAEAVAGIFSIKQVSEGTIFGPFIGVYCFDRQDAYNHGYHWDIVVNNMFHHCIDGRDSNRANWMRYFNHSGSDRLQNLEAFQQGYKVFYRAIRHIPAHTELLVWHSDDYYRDLFQHHPNIQFKGNKSLLEIMSNMKEFEDVKFTNNNNNNITNNVNNNRKINRKVANHNEKDNSIKKF